MDLKEYAAADSVTTAPGMKNVPGQPYVVRETSRSLLEVGNVGEGGDRGVQQLARCWSEAEM
ncbi:hypothetical protein RvY_02832 [Ramazzottius varieornatus]|uniref:Uncharacterized protein n=1 Tax=Ramazzottius varieornatus TaxID=947166 RepID=A0A1D1UPU4_RAMVA|nr:hypothetical protein RvY_02832 [Ramazzottius varieornatus]